jgi:hypothetical protein
MITDLMTEKSPITETKASFFARKAAEYKKMFEYFKGTGNKIGQITAAGMWHAYAYLEDVNGPNAKWHFDNGNSISRLQANCSAQAYL